MNRIWARAKRISPSSRVRTRRVGRASVLLATLLVLSFSLSGCLSSGFTYVSHRNPDGTLLGFKLPGSWKVFDTKQVLEAENGPISSSEAQSIADGEWTEVFSASPKASANFFGTAEQSPYPVGIVAAEPLTESERDGLDFSELRAQLIGTDPLAASSPDPYNVTAYNEFVGEDGIRGSTLTTNIKLPTGPTAVLTQIVAVDGGTNWIFYLGVACKASCWGPNAGLIKQILKSWSLKETPT